MPIIQPSPYITPKNFLEMTEDFCGITASGELYTYPGGGKITIVNSSAQTEFGILQYEDPGIVAQTEAYRIGPLVTGSGTGVLRWRAKFRGSLATFPTTECAWYFGAHAPIGTGEGFYIFWDNGASNWKFRTEDGGSQQDTVLTALGVAAGVGTTWKTIDVIVDFGRATAYCYVNGALVATHSTTMPSGSLQPFHVLSDRTVVLGTLTRIQFDYFNLIWQKSR